VVTKLTTSALIVGAGPAGAATSIYLTLAGINHVIIDKATFPRDKVCGDACSGKTAAVIRKAHPEWMTELMQDKEAVLPSQGIVFVAPNGTSVKIPFKPDDSAAHTVVGFTSPRIAFDDFLFQKLASPYATIFEGAMIQKIERIDLNTICVTFIKGIEIYVVHTALVIGADGDKSIVRDAMMTDTHLSRSYAVGLRGYYEGVTGMKNDNYIELHFLKELLPGYFWVFPLAGGRVNAGVGMSTSVIRRKKVNLRQQMLEIIAHHPTISPRFSGAKLIGKIQGWGLPMGVKKMKISGDNFMLTGDAASLVDPFSGERIGNAMYSGMLAALAVEKCMLADNFSADHLKQHYDVILDRAIGKELNFSYILQRLCQHGSLIDLVVNKAANSDTLRRTISSMFFDLDVRKQLSKPSFYLKILMNR